MKLESIIRNVVNIFHQGKKPTDQSRLAALPRSICEVEKLGIFSQRWLKDIFRDSSIEREYTEDYIRINALQIPEMTGGINPGDRRALYYLARSTKPRMILEIGTHIGSSTVALALAAARNRADGVTTSIVTVDIIDVNDQRIHPWLEHKSPASPRDLIERIDCGDLVSFEVNTSIEKLQHTHDNFDMIFLDGDHSADNVYQEIPLALKCLTGEGLLVLHDYFPNMQPLWLDDPPVPGVFLALDRFSSEGAGFIAVPLGKLPWPTKLGTDITSMAILSKNQVREKFSLS